VAEIQGLSPATRYLYRVRSGATVSPTFAFRTAPQADTALRIAWFADNQDGPQVLAQHVPRIVARAPDLVLVPGDIVQQGDELWRWTSEWFDPLAIGALAQTTPILVARGNHDGEHAFAYAYTALPGNEAWYAFRYGDVFFVFLDTEAPTRSVVPDLDQSVFLEQALLAPEAQAAAFRVVAFHQPPYTNLWDSSNVTNCANGGPYDGAWTVRSDWVPLFESLGVDLVVSGHTHSYQHGQRNGVHYVLVGGGGGALDTYRGCNGSTFWDFIDVEAPAFHYNMMEVAAGTLVWTAYDTSDAQLHRFVIEQDP
jgi:3',5'-cyclic AMP phosphodiesterase CpdA